jgi:hypothetical protein
MATIALPQGINRIEWTRPRRAAYAVQSAYSAKVTVVDRGTIVEGWRAQVGIAVTADPRAWRAWQAAMQGPVNDTDVPAVYAPQVSSTSNPTIGTVTSNTQITLAGLPVSETNYLLAGSLMTIYTGASSTKPRLVTLTQNVSSDGSGNGVAHFDPPIGGLATAGVCVVREPFCRMRLAPPYELGYVEDMPGLYTPASLLLQEVVE